MGCLTDFIIYVSILTFDLALITVIFSKVGG